MSKLLLFRHVCCGDRLTSRNTCRSHEFVVMHIRCIELHVHYDCIILRRYLSSCCACPFLSPIHSALTRFDHAFDRACLTGSATHLFKFANCDGTLCLCHIFCNRKDKINTCRSNGAQLGSWLQLLLHTTITLKGTEHPICLSTRSHNVLSSRTSKRRESTYVLARR